MPELPEVSKLAAHLSPILRGVRLLSVSGPKRDGLIKAPATRDHLRQLVSANASVEKVWNYSKYLFMRIASDRGVFVLTTHFRFTGWWNAAWDSSSQQFVHAPPKESELCFTTTKGELVFTDPRALAVMWLMSEETWKSLSPHLNLGPQVTSGGFTRELFIQRCLKGKLPICDVLLDQRAFSGIGNYLRAEILYRANQNPLQIASSIPQTQIENIYHQIKEVVKLALSRDGNDWWQVFRRKQTQEGYSVEDWSIRRGEYIGHQNTSTYMKSPNTSVTQAMQLI